MERFYYKKKDNTGFLNLKSPITGENYIQITKEEFNELTKPKIPELTAEQKTLLEISKLKRELAETDYKCLKYVDGALTEEEYAPIKAQRAEFRRQINELEAKL